MGCRNKKKQSYFLQLKSSPPPLQQQQYRLMSEEKVQNQDELRGNSRRSRKDQQGRDYICGCGKKYLSYPALYTHIKTKHDGNQPQGTQKTGVTTIPRRNKQKIDEKILAQIYKYMTIEHLKILNLLDENATGKVPLNHRIKKQNLCKQIFQAYTQINKKETNLVLNKQSNLQTVLAVYLLNVGQFTSESLYHYYALFAKHFRACFYENGQEVFDNCFQGEGQNKLSSFTTEECCFAPLMADFFIRYYILQESKDQNYNSLMELLTYDFLSWMFDRKLTNIQVIFNKEYKILSKEIIQPKPCEKKSSKMDQNRKEDSGEVDSNQISQQQSSKHQKNGSQNNKQQKNGMQAEQSLPNKEEESKRE